LTEDEPVKKKAKQKKKPKKKPEVRDEGEEKAVLVEPVGSDKNKPKQSSVNKKNN